MKKILYLLAFFSTLSAQWRVNLQISPHPPARVREWERNPSIVTLSVSYYGSSMARFRLKAVLTHSSKGRIFEGWSKTLSINPHQTINLTNIQMVDWNSVTYDRNVADIVYRTGKIPEGLYRLCVSVYPSGSSSSAVTGCDEFEISFPAPPRLLDPGDRDTIRLLRFSWTRVNTRLPVRYILRVWQLLPGDDYSTAMSRPPVLEKTLFTTSYFHGMRSPVLMQGRYIWQVQAIDENGDPLGRNDGKSAVREFYYIRSEGVLLPRVLKIGKFVVEVNFYEPSATYRNLSGGGRSFFIDELTSSRVYFDVTFSNLASSNTAGDTLRIVSGSVTAEFDTGIVLHKEGFDFRVFNIVMMPESAKATISVAALAVHDVSGPDPWVIPNIKCRVDPSLHFSTRVPASDQQFRAGDVFFRTTGDIALEFSPPRRHGKGPGGLPGRWRPGTSRYGIYISHGETIMRHEMLTSNHGFIYGQYEFSGGHVNKDGFSADLLLTSPFKFTTVSPYGFVFDVSEAAIRFSKNRVKKGYIKGKLLLPVGENGVLSLEKDDTVSVTIDSVPFDSTLTLTGVVEKIPAFKWGNFGIFHPGRAYFRFSAEPLEFESPVDGDRLIDESLFSVDTLRGLAFQIESSDILFIWSEDLKNDAIKLKCRAMSGWIWIMEQGVTGKLWFEERNDSIWKGQFGRPGESDYQADAKFGLKFISRPRDSFYFNIAFAGNSLFDARLDGKADELPYPSGIEFNFRRLNLTSTGMFIGGEISFSHPDTLDYWGLIFMARRGVMSIRTGRVLFTDADISEPVHFSSPFNIIWGAIFADGHAGDFYFNQGNPHLKFDGFPLTLVSGALSEYQADIPDTQSLLGALIIKGRLHFRFFGITDTILTIYDHKYDVPDTLYRGRLVYLYDPRSFGLEGEWANQATFNMSEVVYDSAQQYGFIGTGTATVQVLNNVTTEVEAMFDSLATSMCLRTETTTRIRTSFLSNIGNVTNIWGCVYFEGNVIERMVIGGELAVSSTENPNPIFMRATGAYARVSLSIEPDVYQISIAGRFVMKSLEGVEMDAYARLYIEPNNRIIEGDVEGRIDISAGFSSVVGAGITAYGKLSMKISPEYFYVQGMAGLSGFFTSGQLSSIISVGGTPSIGLGAGVEGGFFMGVNAPKNEAWVMRHSEGRFGVDLDNLTDRLTGFYAFIDVSSSIDIGIFGGGIEVYLGIGVFSSLREGAVCAALDGQYLVGDLGVYLYGEILWGLVYASGELELEFTGPCPFAIEGSMELRGCVAFVICGSVNIDVGYNSTRGFYIE